MTTEIELHTLTIFEWGLHKVNSPLANWEDYKNDLWIFYRTRELFFYESELLHDHKAESMEALMQKHPDRFIRAGKRNKYLKNFTSEDIQQKHDEIQKIAEANGAKWDESEDEITWFDVWLEGVVITSDDFFYYRFLVCHLRHLDLIEIDDFLTYQYKTYFTGNCKTFVRKIRLAVLDYGATLLHPNHKTTVMECLKMIEMECQHGEEDFDFNKSKKLRKRHSGDGLTSLTLLQTSYFISLLRQTKIVLEDDGMLTDTEAGMGFHLLTWYSADTLRTNVGLKKQDGVTYTDRKAVRENLYRLIALIDKEIELHRGKSPE